MQASDWEFKNRASLFGALFGVSFALYAIDPVNVTAAFVNRFGTHAPVEADRLVQWLFLGATGWIVAAAALRTWASAYLQAAVVYSAVVQSTELVADGPYRHVRNPLYFANLLLVIGMSAFMSLVGCVVAIVGMWLLCYRLIRREEAAFDTTQSASYERYRLAVPRWWPSGVARTAAGGRVPNWRAAFKAESWCWGYALAALAFAATLKFWLYCLILALSLGSFFYFNRNADADAAR
jgi:protein-S-isoprenylcysteine O-methyltransferase Ste14